MDLTQVTPLILTYNEQANLKRCLERLTWAGSVVVIDSQSQDQTLEIASAFANVQVIQRQFDCHTNQWNFGLDQIATRWALTLDADYICSSEFIQEIQRSSEDFDVYFAPFSYSVLGKKLRGSLYPPRAVLFKPTQCRYIPDGHTQLLNVEGRAVGRLEQRIDHDDRKPFGRWVQSQLKYAELEVEKILGAHDSDLGWKDRLRKKLVVAPLLTPFFCLFYKRLVLDGAAGLYYTFQRTLAELMLSLALLDRKLRSRTPQA